MKIKRIKDTSGSMCNKITRGGNLTIHGEMIKIDGDHPTVGIYFRNKANGNHFVKVEVDAVLVNERDIIIIEVPLDLDVMTKWVLEIRTQFEGDDILADAPLVAVFDVSLRVRRETYCRRKRPPRRL